MINIKPTIRYCLMCEKNTEWVLDTLIRHSKCKLCGADSRFALRPQIKDECGVFIDSKTKSMDEIRHLVHTQSIRKKNNRLYELKDKLKELNKTNKIKNKKVHELLINAHKENKQLKVELTYRQNTIKQLKDEIKKLKRMCLNDNKKE